jgi:ATP-dependent Clp protease ATP-binding subunit ClpX
MYTVPSDEMIESCIVTKEMIEGTGEPKLSYRDELPTTKKSRKKSSRTVGETA